MSAFDFLKAKSAHLHWRVKLLGYLNGQNTLTQAEVLSHEQCELGKWIYSEGLKVYANLPEMQELEKTHKELHETIHRVIEFKDKNMLKEAKDEYELMREVSDVLMEMLDFLYENEKKHL